MALNNFLSKQGHKVVFNIDNMDDKGYIQAIRLRNIVNFRLMNKEEKTEPGCPDVIIESMFGEKYTITREELIKRYVFITGKKISMAGLKRNIYYKAIISDNTPVYYFIVPDNALGIIGNKKVPKGAVVAYLGDSDGNIDKSTFGVMQYNTFKKMCATPMTDKIRRNASRKYKLFSIYDKKLMESNKPNSYKILVSSIRANGCNPLHMAKPSVNRAVQVNRQPVNSNRQPINVGGQLSNKVQDQSNMATRQMSAPVNQSPLMFLAIRRLYNADNKLVGYRLKSNRGTEKNVDIATVFKMCEAKQVKNLVASKTTNADGTITRYIRGNNIKIDQIPIERLQ